MNVNPDLVAPICLSSASSFLLNFEKGLAKEAIIGGIDNIRECSRGDQSSGKFEGDDPMPQATEDMIKKLNGILAQALAMN